MRLGVACALTDLSDFGGAKLTEICDSLPWMPMNHRAKCDGEIRNRTAVWFSF